MAKKKAKPEESRISGNAESLDAADVVSRLTENEFLTPGMTAALEDRSGAQLEQLDTVLRRSPRGVVMDLPLLADERKLLRRGTKKTSKTKVVRSLSPISIVGELKRSAADTYGAEVIVTGETAQACGIGIPAPFVIEYLAWLDVLPLGRVITLVGDPESLKTALMFEFLRWFCVHGGFGAYIENEFRYNQPFMESILREHAELLIPHQCHSQEEWQAALFFYLKKVKEKMLGTSESPGPGRVQPVAFGVDSFSSVLSKETIDKVKEAGHGDRAHPLEALKNTQYLKTLAAEIANWPFTVIFTNQLKHGTDQMGRPTTRQGGGCQLQFVESLQLRVRKVRQATSEATGETVVDIRLDCQRNTLGPGDRTTMARMKWNYEVDPDTGLSRQVTTWDWDWALVNLLHKQSSKRIKDAIRDLLQITFPKESALTAAAASPVLGVPASKPISWSEMGKLINSDPELINQLRDIFDIQPRTLFKPAVDYVEQVRRDREEHLQI